MSLDFIKASVKTSIIGVDETGYGSGSGRVYVCAFAAPKNWTMAGLNDSKKLSKVKREELEKKLMEQAREPGFSVAICDVHPNNLEEYKKYGTNMHGVLKFLYYKSVSLAIASRNVKDSLIVLDGVIKFPEYPESLGESVSLPKADGLVPQVMAASIIAKVWRDAYMTRLSEKYPQYGWDKNYGYLTKQHMDAIYKHGYCDEHRLMYAPMKNLIKSS